MLRNVFKMVSVLLLIVCTNGFGDSPAKLSALGSSRWLTDDGHIKRDPVFWPNSNALAYSVEDPATGVLRLVKHDLTTNKIVPLLERNPASTRELTVSADGNVYAYNTVSGLSSTITVIDKRSNRRMKIPRMGKASWNNWPTVSPDGSRLLFVEGAHSIFEFDLVENKGRASVRQISRNAQHQSDYWPRFSPSGRHVVFASNRDNDFEIYSMSGTGTGVRRLTQSHGIDMRPSFSPDEEEIAFTSNRDGNFEVYVMSSSGGAARRITFNPERDDFAIWHPNGKQLAIVSEHDGQHDIRLVDVK